MIWNYFLLAKLVHGIANIFIGFSADFAENKKAVWEIQWPKFDLAIR